MKTTHPTHQTRWRVSEEMAAELGMVRRESGLRSWDAFFRAMLQKWDSPSTPAPAIQVAEWFKPAQESLQEIRSLLVVIRGQIEAEDEAARALHHEQAQTNELVRRFNLLLTLALGMDPKDLDANGTSPALSTRKDDVLRKIRRRTS